MSNTDSKVSSYRLTNALYGLLESSERLRYEALVSRHLELKSRRKSLPQRISAAALIVVAAIPTLYGLLPEKWGEYRWGWVSAAAILAIIYIWLLVQQLMEDTTEADQLEKQLLPGGLAGLDAQPEFLATLAHTYVTRWEMARAVLEDDPAPEIRKRYTEIENHWQEKLKRLPPKLKRLVEDGKLPQNEYERVLNWIPEPLRKGRENDPS